MRGGLYRTSLYKDSTFSARPQEEAFWQKRQAKLRQMSGLQTTDQDSLKHEDQENVYAASSGDALQLGWKVRLHDGQRCDTPMHICPETCRSVVLPR